MSISPGLPLGATTSQPTVAAAAGPTATYPMGPTAALVAAHSATTAAYRMPRPSRASEDPGVTLVAASGSHGEAEDAAAREFQSALNREAASLVIAWCAALQGLWAFAAADGEAAREAAKRGVEDGLARMARVLAAWLEAHASPAEEASALVFRFPRALVGRQLHEAVNAGARGRPGGARDAEFMEVASHTATRILQMAVTPQEESLWRIFAGLELEESECGLLGDAESFGKHLHLKLGSVHCIQVMQDWEWPYMYALADLGYDLAARALLEASSDPGSCDPEGPKQLPRGGKLRVLEIGWGQGISGRRLLGEPERTGTCRQGIQVQYEVIELHPVVAEDARREAQNRPPGAFTVHEGPWELIVPTLPDGAYDLIFYDPFPMTPQHAGQQPRSEKWGLPLSVLENLLFYRLLRPGGVLVQYAISHGRSTATDYLKQIAPMFAELRCMKLRGLAPESCTSYALFEQAKDLDVSALIK